MPPCVESQKSHGAWQLKKHIPDSIVVQGHPDYDLLTRLAAEITERAGGQKALAERFTPMLRQCVDDVIMTPKTGRRSYDELEKTEKTYIGTRVEIELRALLRLPKGNLDTLILGKDVDIKNTMGSNWMIPTEAIGHPCILVAADEPRAMCFLGLIVAKLDYLTAGQNKDAKKSVSAEGFANILWLLREEPYPRNFWQTVPSDSIDRIFSGSSGNQRMASLFREVQDTPIKREIVEAVAKQKDFMRRVRSDNGRGTRDILLRESILLLSGDFDAGLIRQLGLPECSRSEFISRQVRTAQDMYLASKHGIIVSAADK